CALFRHCWFGIYGAVKRHRLSWAAGRVDSGENMMGKVNIATAALDDVAICCGAPTTPALSCNLEDGCALAVYDSLAAVESIWREFEGTADCTAFQTFDWLSAWQRHIGARDGFNPAIVIARDPVGTILFILPLAIHRTGGIRELVWLGSALCDYNAPLLAKDFAQRLEPSEFISLWKKT